MDKKSKQKSTSSKVATRKKAMIQYLAKSLGNVTDAIKLFNEKESTKISRACHYKWLKEDEEYKKNVEEAYDKRIDVVEKALMNMVKNGSVQAAIYFLKTQGRKRDWNEKIEMETTIKEAPIQIIIEK